MGFVVTGGAQMMCTFGTGPANLMLAPKNMVNHKMPIANIMDNVPNVNILPFIMCTSMANPTVASATAAALGVLTPMPCIPVTPAPWTPGSPTVLIANMPALNMNSKLMCVYGGSISIVNAGQTSIMVP